jgi:hypothetical protein
VSVAARAAVAGALFLALFSGLYSAGAALGAWPPAPEGGFAGSDLASGFAFGLVLLVTLLVPRPRAASGTG